MFADIIRAAIQGTGSVTLTPSDGAGIAFDSFIAGKRDEPLDAFAERTPVAHALYYVAAAEDIPEAMCGDRDAQGRPWTVHDGTTTYDVLSVATRTGGRSEIRVRPHTDA